MEKHKEKVGSQLLVLLIVMVKMVVNMVEEVDMVCTSTSQLVVEMVLVEQ